MSSSLEASYPPLFRQSHHLPHHPNLTDHQPIEQDLIPLIDLQHLDPEKLAEACRDWGIFRLVNHGIPETFLDQLRDQAKELLSLPFETKQIKFSHPISYFWGTPALTTKGLPMAKDLGNMNWVEGFHVLLGKLSIFQQQDPNLISFRSVLEEYGKHMGRILISVFESMVTSLGLDPELCKFIISEPSGLIRVYRYPYYNEPDQVPGMIAHTDSSTIAILNQDVVGGLQVLKDDKWIDVKPVAGSLIINLGDMMQALSSDEFKSVYHKVRLNKCEERFSICYFVFPEDEKVIQSLKYKPFSYRDFREQVQRDVQTNGVKVGLHRFKLD